MVIETILGYRFCFELLSAMLPRFQFPHFYEQKTSTLMTNSSHFVPSTPRIYLELQTEARQIEQNEYDGA